MSSGEVPTEERAYVMGACIIISSIVMVGGIIYSGYQFYKNKPGTRIERSADSLDNKINFELK